MSKPFVMVLRVLFWIFLPMTIWSVISWVIFSNTRAWIAVLGCGLVSGYTYFLDHQFGRPRKVEDDDDDEDE